MARETDPQGTWVRWHVRFAAPLAGLAALLFLLMGDLSGSLGRIEVSDLPAYSLSSVHSTLDRAAAVDRARRAWCLWNGYQRESVVVDSAAGQRGASTLPDSEAARCVAAFATDADATVSGDRTGARLVRSFIVLDAAFVLLVSFLAVGAIMRRRSTLDPADPIDRGLIAATNLRPMVLLFAAVLLTEGAEDSAQWLLGAPSASESAVNAAGAVLAFAPTLKMLAFGILILLLITLGVRRSVTYVEGRLALADRARTDRGRNLRTFGLLRIQVAVVTVFALLMSGIGQNQIPDALLRLGDLDGYASARLLALLALLMGLAAVGGLSLLIWRSSHRVALTREDRLPPPAPALVCLAVVAVVGISCLSGWRNLSGLALVLAVIVLLSTFSGAPFWRLGPEPASAANYQQAETMTSGRAGLVTLDIRGRTERLARWLAAVPVAILGVAAIRAALPPLLVLGSVRAAGAGRLACIVVIGAGLAVLAGLIPKMLHSADRRLHPDPEQPATGHRLYWCLAVLAAAGYVLSVLPASRDAFPILIGPVAIVAFFLAAVLVMGNELHRLAERTMPVAGLRAFGARRNPVLALLVLWFIVASHLDTQGHHQARVLDVARPSTQPSVTQAFDAWARSNCAIGGTVAEDLPMVFVAAQGGGVRAAYWTAAVLDAAFPAAPSAATDACGVPARSHVFALSGASGGSLGIVSWLNGPSAERPWYQRTASAGGQPKWYDTALSADHLSSVASWMLNVDAPRALIGFGGADRAAALEQSWERSQPALRHPFLGSYAASTSVNVGTTWRPLALLNGTAVESGCRALTAPVWLTSLDSATPGALGCRRTPSVAGDGGPTDATGLYDLTDVFLCRGQDVRQSTAALFSARFPYVTPSGQLTRCGSDSSHTYVVDGGYLDNSGSMTATDLFQQTEASIRAHNATLARCQQNPDCGVAPAERPTRRIKPIFVQIDNGYTSLAQGSNDARPRELGVPPRSRLAVAGAVEHGARQRSYEVFRSDPVPPGNPTAERLEVVYLRVANSPHPGVQAPLGWVMSGSARDELCQELARLDLRQLVAQAAPGTSGAAHC